MTHSVPNHYSYEFKFDIEKLPAIQTDQIPLKVSICGFLCGIIFALLGAFELISYLLDLSDETYGFNISQEMADINLFIFRYAFDSFILLFGVIIIALSVGAMLRRKIIYFDGDNIKITYLPLFKPQHTEVIPLYDYLGILLKVEYYQLGLINRNRYIVELYHKDNSKNVPLYISIHSNKIREMWEYYAAKLKMPALFLTDHGLVSKHHSELNKTLQTMAKRWQLNLDEKEKDYGIPKSITYKEKINKTVIKEKKLFFDIFSILSVLTGILLFLILSYSIKYYPYITAAIGTEWFVILFAACSFTMLFMLLSVFCKDVLIITKHEIVLGHNISFLRMDVEFIPKDEVESVDIGHNPLTDRYYITIISKNQSIVFGKNMPMSDLQWLRGCIIREIIK